MITMLLIVLLIVCVIAFCCKEINTDTFYVGFIGLIMICDIVCIAIHLIKLMM